MRAQHRKNATRGRHRAQGASPFLGHRRQQAVFGALVAVGFLLGAVPAKPSPTDVSAVNAARRQAAAATVVGAQRPTAPEQVAPPGRREAGSTAVAPAPSAAPTTAPPATTPSPRAAEESTPGALGGSGEAVSPDDLGPGATEVIPGRRGTGPAASVRRTTSGTVALTFDDGPDPVQTPRLLKLLAEHQATATFCLVGTRVRAHPELVRQIAAAGHALCNHSWDHSFTLGRKPVREIRADLEATDRAIRAAVADAKIPYFRAPGGHFTDRLVRVADEFAMTSLYWEVDPRDWDHPEGETDTAHVERVVTEVRRHVRDGSIVLSHDFNQPGTIKAYETLLPHLTDKFSLGLP